jgi:hypothetical protein
MTSFLIRRILPLLVLGSLSLASCTVHEHDSGYRDRGRGYGRDRDHRHDRGHRDYGYQRGRY